MDKREWKAAHGNRRGFTLGELLIVVAILMVLVAVAIPTGLYQLEKVRETVDIAHLRQAKSAAAAYFITNPPTDSKVVRKYYDVYSGELVSWKDEKAVKNIPLYGKGTRAKGLGLWTENGLKYNENLDVRDCLIMVVCDQDGGICCGWVKPDYAIRADPFKFLATMVSEDGKTILFPTRSASKWNVPVDERDPRLFLIDQDLQKVVNREDNSEEIDEIYYTLEMYYNLDKLLEHKTIQSNSTLALRVELFFNTQVHSIDPNAPDGNNFFLQTIFQKLMGDAEAVTLATQFWAKIAEFNKTEVDALSGATKALDW